MIQQNDRTCSLKRNNNHKGDKDVESKPYKFDTIKKDEYLASIRQGHTRGLAASLVGIHRATVSIYMKKDNGFAEAVSEAESDAIGEVALIMLGLLYLKGN